MSFAKIFAVLIVSVGVTYGVYQIASEAGGNEQTKVPAATENSQSLVGEFDNRISSP